MCWSYLKYPSKQSMCHTNSIQDTHDDIMEQITHEGAHSRATIVKWSKLVTSIVSIFASIRRKAGITQFDVCRDDI